MAWRVPPAHAQHRGIGKAGDDARICYCLRRWRIEQHKVVVLPQRLHQASHRRRHQQAKRIRFARAASDVVHTRGPVLADDIGGRGLTLQAVDKPWTRASLRQPGE